MFIFVSGGVRSGKSEWAEQAALILSRDNPRIYLATARIADEDMRCRVARHQKARSGRGFLTLERPRDLWGIFHAIPANAAVLLECLPNWLANEMFPEDGSIIGAVRLEEEIFRTALALKERCRHLLIVSDDIFSDGVAYDEVTENYRRLLGRLHVRLAGAADAAVECIAGLARCAKGEAGIMSLGLL
ncbi:MAG: bifunctional adenosylcobinamide kinase/adenosylcobinamide-phosphate guanylyltransferase [Fretibacterium sp.]|nr:bifunctional adenosylcobinamide kinase/adenosylcobinamide-phosphate guanylyltransferase [Fretibacterium sp.]